MARLYADVLLTEAQALARTKTEGPYSKGNLARTIRKSGPRVVGTTVVGSIGSRASYAAAVERGAVVHEIFPRGAPHVYRWSRYAKAPKLKFVWRGHTVYMNQIPGSPNTIGRSHPGQSGKHFLADALIGVAARHNLRVIIFEV